MLNTDPKEVAKHRKLANAKRNVRNLLEDSIRARMGQRLGMAEEHTQEKRSQSALQDTEEDRPGRLNTELDEALDDVKFDDKQSHASCKVSDIEGIIFGGISSRFWLLRKHINSLDSESLKNIPFYSWNCITL